MKSYWIAEEHVQSVFKMHHVKPKEAPNNAKMTPNQQSHKKRIEATRGSKQNKVVPGRGWVNVLQPPNELKEHQSCPSWHQEKHQAVHEGPMIDPGVAEENPGSDHGRPKGAPKELQEVKKEAQESEKCANLVFEKC